MKNLFLNGFGVIKKVKTTIKNFQYKSFTLKLLPTNEEKKILETYNYDPFRHFIKYDESNFNLNIHPATINILNLKNLKVDSENLYTKGELLNFFIHNWYDKNKISIESITIFRSINDNNYYITVYCLVFVKIPTT